MQAAYLKKRVELLENTVDGSNGLSEQFGGLRTDLATFREQFLQFQGETRGELSAIRQEMKHEFAAVRTEMKTEFAEVRQGAEETRSQMRTLHEEVLSRIALLREGSNGGHMRTTRAKKR